MQAGDIVLVQRHTLLGFTIQLLTEGGFNHAALASSATTVIEATPDGVVETCPSYDHYAVYTVGGITDQQRQLAVNYARNHVGLPYDYIQNCGFVANGLREAFGLGRIPALWDKHGAVVCSALVDLSLRAAGVVLRPDRQPGDITPMGCIYTPAVQFAENHYLWEL